MKDGTWVFEGYDKDNGIIDHNDIEFVGKWKFIPNNKITEVKEDDKKVPSNGSKDNTKKTSSKTNNLITNNQSVSNKKRGISNSNVKTGIAGSANVILVLMGSAVALYKSRKYK